MSLSRTFEVYTICTILGSQVRIAGHPAFPWEKSLVPPTHYSTPLPTACTVRTQALSLMSLYALVAASPSLVNSSRSNNTPPTPTPTIPAIYRTSDVTTSAHQKPLG